LQQNLLPRRGKRPSLGAQEYFHQQIMEQKLAEETPEEKMNPNGPVS
jgi:hypothetical protein